MPRKRGDKWYTDFVYDTENGKVRHRKLIRNAHNKHDAVQAETKIRHEIFQGTYGPKVLKDKPMVDFIEQDFKPFVEANKKDFRNLMSTARSWSELSPLRGKTLRQVSQFDIESAKVQRLRMNTYRGTRIKPRTVWSELIKIATLFTHARTLGFREDNPTKGITVAGVEATRPRFLHADEEVALFDAAKDGPAWLRVFIEVALGTGLRPTEICQLKKSNLDFNRDLLWPSSAKAKGDARLTKGVPMSSHVKEVLQAWTASTRSLWVFPAQMDARKPIAYQVVNRAFREACERAGIESLSPHKLRHTFGTRLGEADVRIQVIQELMGHSDIRTTRLYVHTSLASKREAVERVNVPVQATRVLEMRKEG